MARKRVLHIQRGFHMSLTYAQQVMREHCSIAWVVEGETIRDTTNEERIELRAQQAQRESLQQPLAALEIPGLTFKGPLPARRDLIRAASDFMRTACPA